MLYQTITKMTLTKIVPYCLFTIACGWVENKTNPQFINSPAVLLLSQATVSCHPCSHGPSKAIRPTWRKLEFGHSK